MTSKIGRKSTEAHREDCEGRRTTEEGGRDAGDMVSGGVVSDRQRRRIKWDDDELMDLGLDSLETTDFAGSLFRKFEAKEMCQRRHQ